MKRILILMGRYLPGHKDGGPLRTIVNVTNLLGEEYDFRIITQDRDHGDFERYPGIEINKWFQVGKANVMYIPPRSFTFSLIMREVKEADVVYSCGCYNDYGYKSLILNRLGLFYRKPLVIASMGSFSEGALGTKKLKKLVFINICKLCGLFRNVTWSVTSELEKKEVYHMIGTNARCIIAEDVPRAIVPGKKQRVNKKAKTRIVFLSRIAPKKNLLGAIEILKKTHTNIEFSVCGPISNESYWQKCEKELKSLPSNVVFHYDGDIPADDVQKCLKEFDLFLFPTLGENYGHVIFEALSVGCIPLIGDQTPWGIIREKNAGYINSVNEIDKFAAYIDNYSSLSEGEKNAIAENAVLVALEKVEQAKKNTGYRKVFNYEYQ